jgi:hypothetical protein
VEEKVGVFVYAWQFGGIAIDVILSQFFASASKNLRGPYKSWFGFEDLIHIPATISL